MRIRQETDLGCGQNKAKYAGKMKYCTENGLDFHIYKLGPNRIKRMIQRRYDVVINITGKSLDTITRQAMEIVYQ
ncbi:MAG: hypothetical protein MI892_00525 [Desulfobacterales bacterium]|nr:hypothetical protein [Desulfobacterales bacterium]